MRPGIIRLLTKLAVIGLCGWPVWEGLDLIRYGMADTKPQTLQQWIAVPGIAFSARVYALTPVGEASDDKTIRRRRDDLAEILAIRPLSARYWLQLAESRVETYESPAKAMEALELSAVTGPNEGYMITQRGLFGVWQWEMLPPDDRARAIKDMAARQISDAKLAWLKTILADKTGPVREEIRSALQAQGFSKSNFARIGL